MSKALIIKKYWDIVRLHFHPIDIENDVPHHDLDDEIPDDDRTVWIKGIRRDGSSLKLTYFFEDN